MRHLTEVLTALMALFAFLAYAHPTTVSNDIDSLEVTTTNDDPDVAIWEVRPSPDAAPLTLNGTIDDVHDQLRAINPNYDEDWKDHPVGSGIVRRYLDIRCEGYLDAVPDRIREGIEYLRKVKGRPSLPPHTCGRVSCSWRSAIRWCNDNDHEKVLPSYHNIADSAQVIVDRCSHSVHGIKGVRGWEGHFDGWRGIVDWASC
ncbi:hypothetical protein BJX61DRAFT_547663 [Aspergillus egyptiacus]|nr:hypothetical protein BJX61DRAFT_547663 [Aspergillus egyptiacus]